MFCAHRVFFVVFLVIAVRLLRIPPEVYLGENRFYVFTQIYEEDLKKKEEKKTQHYWMPRVLT